MRSSPLVAAQGGQMRPDTCTHRNNILKTANTKWEQSFGRQEQHVTRSSQSVLAQHPASEVCPTSSLTMSLSPFLTFNHISQLKQIQPPGRVGNAYCKGRKPNKLPKPNWVTKNRVMKVAILLHSNPAYEHHYRIADAFDSTNTIALQPPHTFD